MQQQKKQLELQLIEDIRVKEMQKKLENERLEKAHKIEEREKSIQEIPEEFWQGKILTEKEQLEALIEQQIQDLEKDLGRTFKPKERASLKEALLQELQSGQKPEKTLKECYEAVQKTSEKLLSITPKNVGKDGK